MAESEVAATKKVVRRNIKFKKSDVPENVNERVQDLVSEALDKFHIEKVC